MKINNNHYLNFKSNQNNKNPKININTPVKAPSNKDALTDGFQAGFKEVISLPYKLISGLFNLAFGKKE